MSLSLMFCAHAQQEVGLGLAELAGCVKIVCDKHCLLQLWTDICQLSRSLQRRRLKGRNSYKTSLSVEQVLRSRIDCHLSVQTGQDLDHSTRSRPVLYRVCERY